eukprot:2170441-Pyramimonas_sp.AAC.1
MHRDWRQRWHFGHRGSTAYPALNARSAVGRGEFLGTASSLGGVQTENSPDIPFTTQVPFQTPHAGLPAQSFQKLGGC